MNELNFARFDARQEQRFAEFEAKLEHRVAELDTKWELRWARLDTRFTSLEERFMAALANQRAELLRWMFAGWVTTLAVLIALSKGLFG